MKAPFIAAAVAAKARAHASAPPGIPPPGAACVEQYCKLQTRASYSIMILGDAKFKLIQN